jgi:hypothetical protein
MAEIASARLGGRCAFELSVTNVDKLPLDFLEIERRAKRFDERDVLVLTHAPTFAEKAKLLPGSAFVVGADTIERVAQPRYYGSKTEMHQALSTIADQGCRFLVFGRSEAGRFTTLEQLKLPPVLRAICDQVPQSDFDESISSTDLRRQAADHQSE